MSMKHTYQLVINHGRVFDGTLNASKICHLGINHGVIETISSTPILEVADRVIDAQGYWVMPGFIDTHTHYDAEVLVNPALSESVRHGVTTIITGSCSLSLIHCNSLDSADLFSRVEALPYDPVLQILDTHKCWNHAQGWIDHLSQLPLGPNVASMLGHSDIRTHVMGLGRSTTGEVPTANENDQMIAMVNDAMQAGFVGLSTMTNPWDKLAGDRFRSRSLPSTYARWKEYRSLHKILRKWNRVLQSAPNLNTKINIINFFLTSAGFLWRKPLKTCLISAADPKSSPWLWRIFSHLTNWVNTVLRSQFAWQALPRTFEVYADGIDLVIFEEFGAGAEAIHLMDEIERNELLQDKKYRRRFRKDYEKLFSPRIWHRDFYDALIIDCPDEQIIGKSIGQVADERGIHVCDTFLDLIVEYGSRFRWKTLIANHRVSVLKKLLSTRSVQVGFADSGAHLRNMAFYNFPLHLLKLIRDDGEQPFMSLEKAAYKLATEQAQWFDLEVGTLTLGAKADIAIINPQGLTQEISEYHEAKMPYMDNLQRMVRRNDQAVRATIINGKVAYELGQFADDFGQIAYGSFLKANTKNFEV
jgi:N-acyl-D-aspartate/D-glutamate deacylase